MLLLISPAKNLDYKTPLPTKKNTKPEFLDKSEILINELKKLAPYDVSTLMKLSDKLGSLNYDRFQSWSLPFNTSNARPAVFAFNGDVYTGLDAYHFDTQDLDYAQNHLRILSGLYGLLKPLDLIQPYRLEMGTKFSNPEGKDLYTFWDGLITDAVNKILTKNKSQDLINLASNEYFKSIQKKDIKTNIITPIFKDKKNGNYKIISFYAKKARGRMSAYIIKNKIIQAEEIKNFYWDGYSFNESMSTDKDWVFTRDQET